MIASRGRLSFPYPVAPQVPEPRRETQVSSCGAGPLRAAHAGEIAVRPGDIPSSHVLKFPWADPADALTVRSSSVCGAPVASMKVFSLKPPVSITNCH
jgi:hypothetical protein